MDSKPVNMLATGCSTQLSRVHGSRSTIPCPQLVVDYGLVMDGVDVHNQLRLQRPSIQKCISLHKYYKQLFLSIVEMAVVNGYIIHCITFKKKGEKPPTHAAYLRHLHTQLLALRTINFETHLNADDLVLVPTPRQQHTLVNTAEFYSSAKQRKRRQYLCKVWSAFADSNTKSFEINFFCLQGSDAFGGRVPLCRHVRRV
ncbi:unnamed protein product [Phytophthora fragariaefolia]|uniref:Unnamed protein product n=1 Tax=Phytophthora fragariaefolia TaxID=1490495 RepID=A0A9W6YPG2_9STRA|nr:unnamed protein product [Phytophthora fragariaefolia]